MDGFLDTRAGDLAATVLLVVTILASRTAAARYIRSQEWGNVQISRRWLVTVRNVALLILSTTLVLVLYVKSSRPAA